MEMRPVFHKRLREIQDDILALGSMVSKALLRSINALQNRDLELARQIITDDQKIEDQRCLLINSHLKVITKSLPKLVRLLVFPIL